MSPGGRASLAFGFGAPETVIAALVAVPFPFDDPQPATTSANPTSTQVVHWILRRISYRPSSIACCGHPRYGSARERPTQLGQSHGKTPRFGARWPCADASGPTLEGVRTEAHILIVEDDEGIGANLQRAL